MLKMLMLAAMVLPMLAAAAEPVAAWNLDNKAELAKMFKNPEAVIAVPGLQGQALSFQGKYKGNKAGCLVIRNFKVDFTKPFTAEVIFKIDKKAERTHFKEFFNMCDSERGPGIRLGYYYGSLRFRSGDGKKFVDVATGTTKVAVSHEEWHLMTVTYDGKVASIYLDGVLSAQKELTVTAPKKTNYLTIGSYRNGYSYPLRGAIDDLKFYNVCKDASQVAEKYIEIFGE